MVWSEMCDYTEADIYVETPYTGLDSLRCQPIDFDKVKVVQIEGGSAGAWVVSNVNAENCSCCCFSSLR